MKIRYRSGSSFDAILLSRTDNVMRVATQGSDDLLELTRVDGAWISEDCEPVEVEFASTREIPVGETQEEDCICSPELATALINLLLAGDHEADAVPVRRVTPRPGDLQN